MAATLVRILDGNTFVVSDERGDIEASKTDPTGLFANDTRFLSTWVLHVDGIRLNALSTDDLQYFEARFFLVPATGTVYIDPKLSVIRQRAVGGGFHEELTVISHSAEDADLTIRVDADERLRRPVRGQGRAPQARHLRHAGRGRHPGAGLPARDVRARDQDLRLRQGRRRRARLHVQRPPAGARDVDDGPRRGRRRRGPGRPHHADEVRPREQARQAEHGAQPRGVDRRGAAPRVRLGAAQGDVPAQPRGPRGAALLAAHRGRPQPPRRGPAVVHDDVRPRQHLHQPPVAPVRARARRDHAARPRRVAGHPPRRLPRRGPGPDPPRDALRRDGGVRGAAAHAVLRLGRRHAAVRDPARRVRALDRRQGPGQGPRA